MLWRIRTTLPDRPGSLAGITSACGERGIDIIRMQVFPTTPFVTDEFVVEAPDAAGDLEIAALFESAGGSDVAVTRAGEESLDDPLLRYLAGVEQILEEGRNVEDVLHELLDVAPPDVVDYSGHDVLQLTRRNGTRLRISRAVPFTSAERARAQALLSLVGDAGADLPLIAPTSQHAVPLVRAAAIADIDAVAALHERCSIDTLYTRYQAPLPMPMTTRMARRLVSPKDGLALVVQMGLDVVGHGVLESSAEIWTFQLLIEDAWQGRGLGTILVKQAAGRAKALGAQRLTFVSAGSNDRMLRAVGAAGFVARVERREEAVHITVPLSAVRALHAG
ncbi:MAG: GNAT family N-acetyltransferase [Aeromicrobium sp.]